MSWRIFNCHLNGLGRERQRRLGGRCREVARLYQMSLTRIETTRPFVTIQRNVALRIFRKVKFPSYENGRLPSTRASNMLR